MLKLEREQAEDVLRPETPSIVKFHLNLDEYQVNMKGQMLLYPQAHLL